MTAGPGPQTTWVYGVVPASASLDELERRRDSLPELWLVEAGDLAAVVGPAPGDDPRATRDQALAHAHVLEAAVLDAPVVPFQFGTVADDDEVVATDLLEARHDELNWQLDRVRDRVQLTLKVLYRADVVLRDIATNEPEVAHLRDQVDGLPEDAARDMRLQLGRLVDAALTQRRGRDGAAILERLRPATVGVVAGPMEDEFMLLNCDVLVERDAQQPFEAALEEVAGELQDRMRFRLLGPMPAYSFVGTEDTAWA